MREQEGQGRHGGFKRWGQAEGKTQAIFLPGASHPGS